MPFSMWSKHTYVPFGKFDRFYYLFSRGDLKQKIIEAGFKINEIEIETVKKRRPEHLTNKNIFAICEK